MSTDLVIPSTPAEMAAYLDSLKVVPDSSDNSDVNPNKLVPQIRMSNDTDNIIIKLDTQVQEQSRGYYFMMALLSGSRALFIPKDHQHKDLFKMPICSTGIDRPKVFVDNTVKANWLVNEDFIQPHGTYSDAARTVRIETEFGNYVEQECARCPYNLFGSEAGWDPAKSKSRGKACKETRHVFVRLARKVPGLAPFTPRPNEEIWLFEADPAHDSFMRMPLGLGSNREAISNLTLLARARNIAAESAVFKLTVKIETDGGIKWPVAILEIAGFPTPQFKASQAQDLVAIQDFVKRNRRTLIINEEAPF